MSRICTFVDCGTKCTSRSNFNYSTEKKALFCNKHKLDNMVNINAKKCIICNLKTPNFNNPEEKSGLYCINCKLDGMEDVHHQKCITCKDKRPTYNYTNETKPLYCINCKSEEMIDVANPKCIKCKDKRPTFNIVGEKKALYCINCKEENMIDVINKKCISCKKKQGVFNYKNEKKGLYCSNCKNEEMIDVQTKKCIICNEKRASYNYLKKKKKEYCVDCKQDSMISFERSMCKTPLCLMYISNSKKNDGYCIRCFSYLNPDNKLVKYFKTKERAVADFILEEFPNFSWNYDKKIPDGCSRRRPDFLLDLGNQVIIIEVDEFQHEDYSCENKRLMEISSDLNHRNLVMIRFNPDKYINKNNEKIKSCWKDGKILKNSYWNERLNNLKDTINYWLINETDKMIEIINLFYDNYS